MKATGQRVHHLHDGILSAVDTIVDYWAPALLTPPPDESPPGYRLPGSMPPVPIHVLTVHDEAYRTMRDWGALVVDERALTRGPRADTGPDLAMFLARHAEWLARHDIGAECRDELGRAAGALRSLALGLRVRRIVIGRCPDSERPGVRCPGRLYATMRSSADTLPSVVRCDVDREHVWTPGQWHALGRRLGRMHPDGAERLVRGIGAVYRTG